MTNGDNYDPSKASVKDKVKFFNSFVDANKDAKQKPATPSNNTQQPCPLKEIQLVELVEVVAQDKEKWVKGAAMDATDTKVITESVERAAKDGANFKQYINLDKDLEGQAKRHPEYGRNITLRARVKQKDGKTDQLANVKVNFSYKLTKGPNRSNPAPPDPAVWQHTGVDLTGDQKPGFGSKNGAATTSAQTDDKGWTAPVDFFLSAYGGDQFEISAALDPATPGAKGAKPVKTKANYVVWRKFWYQMTYADGYNALKPTSAEQAYAEVFAEMVKANEKKFKESDLPDDLKGRTFLKEYMLKQAGADKKVANIGTGNIDEFKTNDKLKMTTEPKKHPVKANMIICEYQCDAKGPCKLGIHELKSNGQEITVAQGTAGPIVSKPALKAGATLVVVGEWSKTLTNPWVAEGTFTEANIDINKSRASTLTVKVDLSKGTTGAPAPSASKPVYVRLQVETAKSFLGWATAAGIVVVYLPSAPANKSGSEQDYNDTAAHEFGHKWNQTPKPGNAPDSLKDHPLQYVGHRGSGPHCRHGIENYEQKDTYTNAVEPKTKINKTAAATKTHEVKSTKNFNAGYKVLVNNVERKVKSVVDATHLEFTTSFAATKDQVVQQCVDWNDKDQEWPSPNNGDCLMYHRFTTRCSHKFCKTCKPYLQLQDMSSL